MWRWRRCTEIQTLVEGVKNVKCLGRPLYQTDNKWMEVLRSVKRVWRVWEILGKILRREVADSKVEEMFYRAVAEIERTVEGAKTRFLRKILVKRGYWKADRTWSTPNVEEVREATGTQSETTYIG